MAGWSDLIIVRFRPDADSWRLACRECLWTPVGATRSSGSVLGEL